MRKRKTIWLAERNAQGWIIIHGAIGTRRYLYYSMREACRRYRAECLEKQAVFICQ